MIDPEKQLAAPDQGEYIKGEFMWYWTAKLAIAYDVTTECRRKDRYTGEQRRGRRNS